MSSREIAELCDKEHRHVCRDIRAYAGAIVQMERGIDVRSMDWDGKEGVELFGHTPIGGVTMKYEVNPQNKQTYPVYYLDKNAVETVPARELHTFLEVGRDFSAWIKDRISKYEFVETTDYIMLPKTGELENKGLQGKIEYFVTLDMAKQLAMVENNEKGMQVRKYFIECEKQLEQATAPRLRTTNMTNNYTV